METSEVRDKVKQIITQTMFALSGLQPGSSLHQLLDERARPMVDIVP